MRKHSSRQSRELISNTDSCLKIKERKKTLKWSFLEGRKDFSMDLSTSNGGCSKPAVSFSVDSILRKRGVEEEDTEVSTITSNPEGKRYTNIYLPITISLSYNLIIYFFKIHYLIYVFKIIFINIKKIYSRALKKKRRWIMYGIIARFYFFFIFLFPVYIWLYEENKITNVHY